MSLSTKIICFIACHGGPAEHFAAFAEHYIQQGYEVRLCASGPALQKFQERHLTVWHSFDAEEKQGNLALEIAAKCADATLVITDVGHIFDYEVQKALKIQANHVPTFAYYDNPEPYVPGGYSEIATKVMEVAQKVLFANANLCNSPFKFPSEQRIGIGYYPLTKVEAIIKNRTEHQAQCRKEFLSKYLIKDQGQKVVAYFGGNNEAYFLKAFPSFLTFLEEGIQKIDLSNYVIVLQQHPGAKSQNIDRHALEKWIQEHSSNSNVPQLVISDETSEAIQVFCDGALYYQTSMGPQFALIGIPTIQVGPERYEDILVREKLCLSATNSATFIDTLLTLTAKSVPKEFIYERLGIKSNWKEVLLNPDIIGAEE